jgi:hypothetical protein
MGQALNAPKLLFRAFYFPLQAMMKGNLAQDSFSFRQKTHEFLWINMWITGDNYAFLVDKSRKYPHSINNQPI